MRKLDSLTPDEIKPVVAALIREPEYGGHAEAFAFSDDVALRLDSNRNDDEALPSYGRNAVLNRYYGRIKRALDKLADDGNLIRVGSGERRPEGVSSSREVHYYTPEAYAAAKEEGDRKRAGQAAEEAAWDVVFRRLKAAGISMGPRGTVSLGDWSVLLDRAGL